MPVTVRVPLSKSVANRWLILRALFPDLVHMHELSQAKDTSILQAALDGRTGDIDLGPAGTAMRFSTAYFSAMPGYEVFLHGTQRMHQRPVGPLVDALRSLGADLEYGGVEGYPPLRIKGKRLRGGEVYIPADMSSQFISALMLIAPATHDGLVIQRTRRGVSQPYVDMTSQVLRQAGVNVEEEGRRIHVHGKVTERVDVPVEGDWSAAAAFLAWTAVSGQPLRIQGLSPDSVQGDKILDQWTGLFGVVSKWEDGVWCLERVRIPADDVQLDLLDYPDLAQSLIMAAVGQGRSGKASGLYTLRIKETDRIAALVESIEAFGGETSASGGSLYWTIGEPSAPQGTLSVFDDHRMAMALAPMAGLFDIQLDAPSVVEKSFPGFWEEMSVAGLSLV